MKLEKQVQIKYKQNTNKIHKRLVFFGINNVLNYGSAPAARGISICCAPAARIFLHFLLCGAPAARHFPLPFLFLRWCACGAPFLFTFSFGTP